MKFGSTRRGRCYPCSSSAALGGIVCGCRWVPVVLCCRCCPTPFEGYLRPSATRSSMTLRHSFAPFPQRTALLPVPSFPSTSHSPLPSSQGIAFLHTVGLIHADIKPDNVALYPPPAPSAAAAATADSAKPAPFDLRLIDLGNAVFATDAVPGVTAGTPSYLSPEARAGRQWGPAVDVWAAGCILYEIITGERAATRSGGPGGDAFGGGGGGGGAGAGAGVAGFGPGPGAFGGAGAASAAATATGGMAGVVRLVERLLTEDVSRRPSAEEALKDALFSEA